MTDMESPIRVPDYPCRRPGTDASSVDHAYIPVTPHSLGEPHDHLRWSHGLFDGAPPAVQQSAALPARRGRGMTSTTPTRHDGTGAPPHTRKRK